MADEPDSLVLRMLRSMDQKLDLMGNDLRDLNGRMARVEERLVRVNRQIDRIERRLELVDGYYNGVPE